MSKYFKVMIIFGTRPEVIKLAPIINVLKKSNNVYITICSTGQHRELLTCAMNDFDIVPDINLDIMKSNQDLFDVTSRILIGMRDVFLLHKPDIVLVHGDTTTALASSLAAFYLNICVGHIEAGLRTNNISSPFPEEFNRQVISKISSYNFVPTKTSRSNLLAEGILDSKIFITGNTVIDALFMMLDKINSDINLHNLIRQFLWDRLHFDFERINFILITGHRRENFGDGFIQIFEAIKLLSIAHPNFHFVYPVHLNPNVREPALNILGTLDNVHLIEPLDYKYFIYLLKYAYFVLTDSGGLQEEAPSLGKPVLVMREFTERPEGVDAGTVKLVGSSTNEIFRSANELICNQSSYSAMANSINPYGDGFASNKIAFHLCDIFSKSFIK